jgi:hypothetical protein
VYDAVDAGMVVILRAGQLKTASDNVGRFDVTVQQAHQVNFFKERQHRIQDLDGFVITQQCTSGDACLEGLTIQILHRQVSRAIFFPVIRGESRGWIPDLGKYSSFAPYTFDQVLKSLVLFTRNVYKSTCKALRYTIRKQFLDSQCPARFNFCGFVRDTETTLSKHALETILSTIEGNVKG